ncbi:hypothetical protein [Flindersiella endophytica]
MTTTIRTLYISTSEPPVVLSKLLDPGTLLNLIGGAPQSVHAASEWQLYIDRDAQRKDAPANPLANRLVRHVHPTFAQVIRGQVLLVGTNDAGDAIDLPWQVLDLARRLT